MPTAAKLFAAFSFALVAFFASSEIIRELPENMSAGNFGLVNTFVGLLAGWKVMGRHASKGYRKAIPFGIWTVCVMVFFSILVHSIYEMLRRSTRLEYDGVQEALEGTFEIAAKFAFVALESPNAIFILVIGGVLAAWFSAWAALRWK